MSARDGGPAFPTQYLNGSGGEYFTSTSDGMSLRDYFAAKVCGALLTACDSDCDLPKLGYQKEVGGPTVAERVAAISYQMADAMLRERMK